MERQIYLTNLDLEDVKANPAVITDIMEKGYVPEIDTTHADANTVSCMVGEHLTSMGHKFHEIYVSPIDTPKNLWGKAKTLKDDETVILVRHMNEYSQATMDAVWNFMFQYKARLVIVLLKKK